MNKLILIVVICLLISSAIVAQSAKILVCDANGLECKQFITLDDAITNALDNEVVVVPKGSYTLTIPITKKIKLSGNCANVAGLPISTEITLIYGSVILGNGSDGASFEGIQFTNDIVLSNTNINAKNLSFFKCRTQSVMVDTTALVVGCFSKLYMHNCIVQNLLYLGYNATNLGFENTILNTIISGSIIGTKLSTIKNCNVFASFATYPIALYNVHRTAIKNCNIFTCNNNAIIENSSNNRCLNNLVSTATGFTTFAKYETNTTVSQTLINTFTSVSSCNYFYSNNYKILATSAGFTASTNGTQTGIYGGSMYFDDNFYPFKPKVVQSNIGTQSDAIGDLDIQTLFNTKK